MGFRFCIMDKPPMAGTSHRNLLVGGSRDTLLSVFRDHYVPAIHELCHTSKTRHVIAFLELIDNSVERRLWKTPRGPPGVLQHQTLAWVRVRVILLRRFKHPRSASLQCHGLPDR